MHENYEKANALTKEVIGAAIEVHRCIGPGLVESIYEKCLMRDLELRSISAVRQSAISVEYKGYTFKEKLRLDVFIDRCLILELKSVENILPIHKAQLLSYMKLTDAPIGLLFNFHSERMVNGIHRMMLKGADRDTVDF